MLSIEDVSAVAEHKLEFSGLRFVITMCDDNPRFKINLVVNSCRPTNGLSSRNYMARRQGGSRLHLMPISISTQGDLASLFSLNMANRRNLAMLKYVLNADH